MKTKLFFSICLMLLAASITAQASIPQGIWTVTQITIEKNIDGIIQTSVYNTPAEVQSFIPSFNELEIINEQSARVRYDGWEETVEYLVDDNLLKIQASDGFMQPFQYSLSGNTLILNTTYNYINNLPTGRAEQIIENRTIVLRK